MKNYHVLATIILLKWEGLLIRHRKELIQMRHRPPVFCIVVGSELFGPCVNYFSVAATKW